MPITDQQYVTLVPYGGTPVRLANQNGSPYPTTGQGSLVFANGPTLTNVTLINPLFEGSFGFGPGTAAAPAIFFRVSDQDTGIFSSGVGAVSFSSNGAQIAEFNSLGLAL